jgi:hypothetical protein
MILAGLTTAVYAMTLSNESLPDLRQILKLILSGVVVSLLIASLSHLKITNKSCQNSLGSTR